MVNLVEISRVMLFVASLQLRSNEVILTVEGLPLSRFRVSYDSNVFEGACQKSSKSIYLVSCDEDSASCDFLGSSDNQNVCQAGNSETAGLLFEEMSVNGIKADIITYNALILGLCKEGKTRKAAYLVKELDRQKFDPNYSTFSALITGQCVRKNPDRAFQLYRSMIRTGRHPNEATLVMLISTFIENEGNDGDAVVSREMLERSTSPNPGTLSELCNGLCQDGKEEVQVATRLCKEVEARHLMPESFQKTGRIFSSRPKSLDDKCESKN
nr:pentatricopeptide repeat-containing protein At4g26680, mitochondrial-like [Coffea arabica]